MTDIAGVDTIRNLVGEPPAEVPIDKSTMSKQQALLQAWNKCYIAIIPYCFKCKVALIWHTPPDENKLFTCPNCSRTWIKGEGWNDKA